MSGFQKISFGPLDWVLRWFGRRLAAYLAKEVGSQTGPLNTTQDLLRVTLQPGDVLLVEGQRRVSSAIKYLTQSTWSHAALYIGYDKAVGLSPDHCFIEADTEAGVRSVGFDQYRGLNTRICRPIGLTPEDRQAVINYALAQIGHEYDLRNVLDLARYLVAMPPVPQAYRRRMLALGSGDPTRAICSTLIAQAFQSIRYPILPSIERVKVDEPGEARRVKEILHIRHHSLFAPRDFDLSPYFQVIKPTLEYGFDYRALEWGTLYEPNAEVEKISPSP
ncbi:MAG: YiiX/YebB-like N1pC/P60 family cysteine hydrolase [Alphaproteobacteria bacterium]